MKDQINFILKRATEYNEKDIKKIKNEKVIEILQSFINFIKTSKDIKLIKDFVKDKNIKFKEIAQPLRISLLGELTGAGLDDIINILGVKEVEIRVNNIIKTFIKLKS